MDKGQCTSYCIFRSSREGYWKILKKKKREKEGAGGPKWEGYCPFLVSGCDLTRRSRPGLVLRMLQPEI